MRDVSGAASISTRVSGGIRSQAGAVRRLNVDGDGQGDLAGHGGEHRAVFVHQTAAHVFWATKLQRNDSTFGQFGENFTVEGLPDDEVRIDGELPGAIMLDL